MIHIGSKVITQTGFKKLKKIYGFTYPKKNQVLTVSQISMHPNPECREKGIVLLRFLETPELHVGICDRKVNGKLNFKEVEL
jgi:hypothetical protein